MFAGEDSELTAKGDSTSISHSLGENPPWLTTRIVIIVNDTGVLYVRVDTGRVFINSRVDLLPLDQTSLGTIRYRLVF